MQNRGSSHLNWNQLHGAKKIILILSGEMASGKTNTGLGREFRTAFGFQLFNTREAIKEDYLRTTQRETTRQDFPSKWYVPLIRERWKVA